MSSSDNNSPESSEPEGELVNWEVFDSLMEITDGEEDPGLMRQLMTGYEKQVNDGLDRLAELGSGSPTESREILHKLLGSAGSISFTAVVESIRKLHDTTVEPPAAERQGILEDIRLCNQRSLVAARTRHPWLTEE
ncbi:hypothetical protein N9Z12_01385 [Opitutaceae bacterium]|nr:hypothetical protein [Opitutaceae bacterium]